MLIEATCNQVNQEGGYTGMTPADFRAYVLGIADAVGFPHDRIILGGDHLGPNPWKGLAPEEALRQRGGYGRRLCRGRLRQDPPRRQHGLPRRTAALSDAVIAGRAARLARAAEDAATRAGTTPPFYIIGTEVPVPGGALEVIEHLEVTDPAAAQTTYRGPRTSLHANAGSGRPFRGCLALSSSPASNSAHENVIVYDPAKARNAQCHAGSSCRELVFEAHSTDYQPREALTALVRDGFAILKVGPGLTFALREALYALEHIAAELCPAPAGQSLIETFGAGHARRSETLAVLLSRLPTGTTYAAPLQLQRPCPLLLASAGGAGRCR